MDTTSKVNTPTIQAHKRQFAWQILVPFLLMAAVIVTGAVLVATGAAGGTRVWADVSTIWIIAPLLVFALMFIVILGFLIYGFTQLLKVTPHYTGKAQSIFVQIAAWTRKIADGVAEPILWVRQASAVLKSIFKL